MAPRQPWGEACGGSACRAEGTAFCSLNGTFPSTSPQRPGKAGFLVVMLLSLPWGQPGAAPPTSPPPRPGSWGHNHPWAGDFRPLQVSPEGLCALPSERLLQSAWDHGRASSKVRAERDPDSQPPPCPREGQAKLPPRPQKTSRPGAGVPHGAEERGAQRAARPLPRHSAMLRSRCPWWGPARAGPGCWT